MNLDDIRSTTKQYADYISRYNQQLQSKSQRFIKNENYSENFSRSIGGKKYNHPPFKKSFDKQEDENNCSYIISLSQYENRRSYDTMDHRTEYEHRASFDQDKEQNKRSIIYGNESYKDVPEDDINETSLSANNQIFQMVFFNKKKTQFNQSVSTAGSFPKAKEHPKAEIPSVKIEDFKLGRKLGAGKFGEVFIARHKKSGFICAIKRLSKSNIDQKLLIQMIREIKIQTFLTHPNIVKMYTFFCDHQYIYLALELCYSGELYEFLRNKRKICQPLTKNIMQQTLKALDYMHENEIIHRDLKPQNIIFHNGLIKLCDFGWSISSKTMRQTFCGTPLYVSPELLKKKNYNNKIDVWSVGILTYELLYGNVPFEITTESDFIKIVQDEINFSKATKISDAAKQFIMICLKKDPRDRYTVPELLEHPFIANQEPISIAEMY